MSTRIESFPTMIRFRGLGPSEAAFGFQYGEFLPYIEKPNETIEIIDLGAGRNFFAFDIVRSDIKANVVGIELYPVIDQYEANMENIIKSDFTELPIKTNSVDVVVSTTGFGMYAKSHQNFKDQLNEVARVTKPNGKVFITIRPDIDWTLEAIDNEIADRDIRNHLINLKTASLVPLYNYLSLNNRFTINIEDDFREAGFSSPIKRQSIDIVETDLMIGLEFTKL